MSMWHGALQIQTRIGGKNRAVGSRRWRAAMAPVGIRKELGEYRAHPKKYAHEIEYQFLAAPMFDRIAEGEVR